MLSIETYMFCNFCGKDYEPELYYLRGYEIRERAKREGWKYINGKDKCPECISNKPVEQTQKTAG